MQLNALLAIPMAAALMAYKGAMHLVDATGTSAETIAYRFVESRSLFLRRKEEQKKRNNRRCRDRFWRTVVVSSRPSARPLPATLKKIMQPNGAAVQISPRSEKNIFLTTCVGFQVLHENAVVTI